jgi:hypothetical protein
MVLWDDYFEPSDGERAFLETGHHGRSRAVQLLLIAEQLSRRRVSGLPTGLGEDAESLRTPRLRWEGSDSFLATRRERAVASTTQFGYDARMATYMWTTAQTESDPGAAVDLLGLSLDDPSPHARLSAILGLLSLAPPEGPVSEIDRYLLACLFQEQYRAPRETGAMARNFLDLLRGQPGEQEPLESAMPTFGGGGGPLSIGVHGTFSEYDMSRVAPMHKFYEYLGQQFSPDLFKDQNRFFRWSGRYSREARNKGARDLQVWLRSVGRTNELDTVYAHSHGGNVALSAAASGVRINFLVLLSVPPVERSPGEWAAIRRNVGYTMSLRSKLDYVILLDLIAGRIRGLRDLLRAERSVGLDFPPEADVHATTPIGWFSHSSWLDQRVWQSTTIEAEVQNKYLLTHPGLH